MSNSVDCEMSCSFLFLASSSIVLLLHFGSCLAVPRIETLTMISFFNLVICADLVGAPEQQRRRFRDKRKQSRPPAVPMGMHPRMSRL
jgi:hypothetical protein